MLQGDPDHGGRILHLQFGEEVFAVAVDRERADEQPLGDLVVGQAFRDQREDLLFAARKWRSGAITSIAGM